MKCYTHPTIDAIGVCSKCGRGVCTQCTKSIDTKLICEKCHTPSKFIEPTKLKQYALICAILGWLGSVNVILIGIYSTLKLYHLGSIRGYQLEVYIVSIITIILTLTLLYGSYQLWKTHLRLGGLLNVLAGIGTLFTYCYFTWFVPLLTEFGLAGLLLCFPSLVSGMLGVISDRFFKKI